MWYDKLIENNKVPDVLLRQGIRKLLKQRLADENKGDVETQQAHLMGLIEFLKNSPIAVNTADANQQHYEVPTRFYQYCLGKNLKYSGCYYKPGVTTWTRPKTTCSNSPVSVQNLPTASRCWSLVAAGVRYRCSWPKKFPKSTFKVVSNSRTQKEYIDQQANQRGIKNLTVITADMNTFTIDEKFDRVVSVEMFEHMRNYQKLTKKVASFLKPDGKLFIHIFTHKEYAYLFEVKDETDWMSKYFFTGGIMPSDDLMFYFNDDLLVEKHWHVNGTHYGKTAEAWLSNMDSHEAEIMPTFY